jgi:hypothetical protein
MWGMPVGCILEETIRCDFDLGGILLRVEGDVVHVQLAYWRCNFFVDVGGTL